jgi:release factor glutamine methyltransferase
VTQQKTQNKNQNVTLQYCTMGITTRLLLQRRRNCSYPLLVAYCLMMLLSRRVTRNVASFATQIHKTRPFSFSRLLATQSSAESSQFAGLTVAEAIHQLSDRLKATDEEPRSAGINLLTKVLKLPWETGYQQLQRESFPTIDNSTSTLHARVLTSSEAKHLEQLVARRLDHEPIQYILGAWDFLDYTFQVRPPLLCPRPETEELVALILKEYARDNTNQQQNQQLRILDVGTGTGCIGISLAAKLSNSHVHAIDVDPIAIQVAAENARAILGEINANFYVSLCAAQDYSETNFDVIVANPPYIPSADYEHLDASVKNYESVHALCGGHDGMDVIRTILQQLPTWASSEGATCYMEVDPSQPVMIQQFIESTPPTMRAIEYVRTIQDMYGKDRFVQLHVSKVV